MIVTTVLISNFTSHQKNKAIYLFWPQFDDGCFKDLHFNFTLKEIFSEESFDSRLDGCLRSGFDILKISVGALKDLSSNKIARKYLLRNSNKIQLNNI
jgi:hypothetical protein